mmetsp:Transcript_39989/g.98100  ORF Transcript_39989/g.98100 Transcript_39989/m.98100 type:complete len:81 (-) Transcript_39989:107-349(-)
MYKFAERDVSMILVLTFPFGEQERIQSQLKETLGTTGIAYIVKSVPETESQDANNILRLGVAGSKGNHKPAFLLRLFDLL